MSFSEPTSYCYNPLEYAAKTSEMYLKKFGSSKKEVILVGMNPGPFGMAQTGVPFGDIAKVRDWLGIEGVVSRPPREHPKRLITGFECQRSEVSGTRLWGWAEDRFGTANSFFKRFFVWNYCPLCFMEEGGKNRTPDKLPEDEREALFVACDEALRGVVEGLQPQWVIGIGAFAEKRINKALKSDFDCSVGRILHPSPASPAANRGWVPQVEAQFEAMGISLP